MFFIEFQYFVPNRIHGDKEISHSEISETNMNDYGRRLVKDDTGREIAVFGDDRQIVFPCVIPYLRVCPFVTDVILIVIVAFPK